MYPVTPAKVPCQDPSRVRNWFGTRIAFESLGFFFVNKQPWKYLTLANTIKARLPSAKVIAELPIVYTVHGIHLNFRDQLSAAMPPSHLFYSTRACTCRLTFTLLMGLAATVNRSLTTLIGNKPNNVREIAAHLGHVVPGESADERWWQTLGKTEELSLVTTTIFIAVFDTTGFDPGELAGLINCRTNSIRWRTNIKYSLASPRYRDGLG
ncbi:hypothetical protein BDP27DRAFT_1369901 [Rhodocollybia butyracea]|uniref:Uncharacterized protein n=1 Tax=Rhodocollybia butyracea TaxID=206335 RepID=A0A9P5PD40_9AGAR|nr:hypothetical protein BDP27DRAFT_1369901 [Rhodocollybia butyracea]